MNLLFLGMAILLGVECILAAAYSISQQSAASEYLTAARRCVELHDCPSRGGRTGGLPLFHGASWIRLLSYSLVTGRDQTAVQSIILASWILSLPIVFFLIHRYLGLRAAALALGLYFPVILVGTDIRVFTYTNLLPFPIALYYASLALFIERRQVVFAAVASIALAAAVSIELGSIVMVPFHIVVVALAARARVFAAIIAAISFVIPFCWDSMDAAREIMRQLPTLRFAVGLAISAAAAVLAARMGPRILPASIVPERVRAVMAAALIYAATAICLAGPLLMQAFPNPRYFLPASVPFLYAIGETTQSLGIRTCTALGALEALCSLLLPFAPHALLILQTAVVIAVALYAFGTAGARALARHPGRSPLGRLWPVLSICVAAIAMSIGDLVMESQRGATQEFTLAEAEQLVAKLYAAGYPYAELLASIQGPGADDLMPLLTERDPNAFGDTPLLRPVDGFGLLVLKVPHALAAQTQGVIAAIAVDNARSAIVVRDERAYLDWIRLQRCSWSIDQGRSVYLCRAPRINEPVLHNWPYVDFDEVSPAVLRSGVRDGSFHFHISVHTPGRRRPHIVRTANEWPATWHITHVEGVEFEGTLPGPEIRLPDREEARGVVEIEYRAVLGGDLPWIWLPHVMEVTQDNARLLETFR